MVTVQVAISKKTSAALSRVVEYLAEEETGYAHLRPHERPGHIFSAVLVLRAGLLDIQRFEIGETCCTPGALEAMEKAFQEPLEFLSRHRAGDWGDVCFDDWQENEFSLQKGFRVLSSYATRAGERLWIITEADRSRTTILLPEEY